MANLGFAVTMQNFLQSQRDILRKHVAELRKYAAVLRKYVAAAKEKLAPFKNFIVRAFELSKKFAKSVWYKGFLPFLGYHHILMILIAVAIILLSLLLAGCSSTSPLIPGIFLISMYYKSYTPSYDPSQVDPGVTAAIANIVGNAILEVRVGYFGICVNPNGGDFLCSNNATALAEQINVDQDPLNLIWVASTFKDSIVFPYLLIVAIILAFITFILLATFPGWHQEEDATTGSDVDVKPFPSRPVSQVALALIFISSIFVLVSVLWQHTASVAAATVSQDLGNGSIRSGVGTASMVLGWFGFVLLIIVTIGLLVMILSIIVLDKLTDG